MGVLHLPPWMRVVGFNFSSPFYLPQTIPNPVPYRGVVIAQGNAAPTRITYSTEIVTSSVPSASYIGQAEYGELFTASVTATITGPGGTYTITGTRTQGPSIYLWEPQYTNIYTQQETLANYPSNGYITNGVVIYPGNWGGGFAGSNTQVATPITSTAEYIAASTPPAGSGPKNLVLATDGQTLASESAVVPGFLTYEAIYQPTTTFWNGGGTLGIGIQSTFISKDYDHTLNFTVPDDCLVPINPNPPGVSVSYSSTTVVASGGPTMMWNSQQSGLGETITTTATISGVNGSATITGTQTTGPGVLISGSTYTGRITWVNYPDPNAAGIVRNGDYISLTPDWPTTGVPYNYTGTNTPIDSTPQYINTVGDIAIAWTAAQAALQLRRQKWFKKNSDTTITNTKAGILPISWSNFLKRSAPQSQHTYRAIPIAIDCNDVLVSDTTNNFDGATAGTRVVQRTAILKYTLPKQSRGQANAILAGLKSTLTMVSRPTGDPDTFDVDLSQTIVGTLTSVQSTHLDVNNNPGSTDLQHTYVNWHIDTQHITGGDTVSLGKGLPWDQDTVVLHPTLRDNSGHYAGIQTMLVCNGTVQEGDPPDSAIGGSIPLGNNPYAVNFGLTPPYPRESINLTETLPDIVVQYRKDVRITYSEAAADVALYLAQTAWPNPPATVGTGADLYREWSDSTPQPGEIIAVLLWGPVLSDGTPLGIFPDTQMTQGTITQTEVIGTATYQYNYDTGAFQFLGWMDAVPHYQVVAASIVSAGTGGSPGHQTVSCSTGVSTPYVAVLDVTINDAGGLGSIDSIHYAGNYTTLPTNPQKEPVLYGPVGAVVSLTMKVVPVAGFDATTGKYLGGITINQVSNPNSNDEGANALVRYSGITWKDVLAVAMKSSINTTTTYNTAYAAALTDIANQLATALQQAQAVGDTATATEIQSLQASASFITNYATQAANRAVSQATGMLLTPFDQALIPYLIVSWPCICLEAGNATDTITATVVSS